MKSPKLNASWRDSARSSKLWIFDSSVTFPLVLMFFNMSIKTFYVVLGFIIFLSVLSYYGFSVPVFARFLRTKIAGTRKIAVPWWLA